MSRHFQCFWLSVLIASCALAQPVITSTDVVNSASYLRQGMPGSGVAQGSIFTIGGSGLGPNTIVTAGPLPLQTSLSGTSVTVTAGGQTYPAFVEMAWNSQVNAVLPSNIPVGSATATVTYHNQISKPEPFQVVSASFAPYTFNSSGKGQASATDLNYQLNTIIHTFRPGDWVVLWGTGLGAISGDDSNLPPVGNLGSPIVHVGNASLTPYYAGRSADFPGLDQVMFQVPSGIQGCYVPVAVEENGVVGGGATIAVSASGSTCSDSILGNDLIAKLAAGGAVDFGFLQMYAIVLRTETLPSQIYAPDYVSATFSEFTPQTAGWANYGVSSGYCAPFINDPDASPGQLDAGPAITLQGPTKASISQSVPGYGQYFSLFSNGIQFFWSGLEYAASGAGGSRVGPFSANDTTSIPSAYLSGIVAGQTLSLSGDLTVTWTGGNPDLQNGDVTIAAYSGSADGSLFSAFMCSVPLANNSFTIPKWVLSTLIPTGADYIGIAPVPNGFIWIGQLNNPVTFQATGLDRGMLVDEFFNGFPVYFK